MNLVYIAGPYRAPYIEGIEQNITMARRHHTYWMREGFASICPHMNTAHMERLFGEESVILPADFEIISRCDILILQGRWKHSKGTVKELGVAITNNLIILCETSISYQGLITYYINDGQNDLLYPHEGLLHSPGWEKGKSLEAFRDYITA